MRDRVMPMRAVCHSVFRLFWGFLLLVIKLCLASNTDGTGLLDRWNDVLVQNYELLFQLGFARIGNCDYNVSDLSADSGPIVPRIDDTLLLPEDLFSGSFTAALRVVHHNVQGLLSKFTDITQWLHSCHGSNIIVCCSETWLQGGSIPAIPGFVSYCSPLLERTTGKRPLPGSCLFVSNTLSPSHPALCEIVEQSSTCLNVSCCFVSIKYSQTAVLSVYRSPSTCCAAAIAELQSILMQLSPHVKYVIVAGDFNIDLKSNLSTTKEYRNLLDDFASFNASVSLAG